MGRRRKADTCSSPPKGLACPRIHLTSFPNARLLKFLLKLLILIVLDYSQQAQAMLFHHDFIHFNEG